MPGIGILLALVLMVFTGATMTGLVMAVITDDPRAIEVFAALTLAYGLISAFTYLVATTRRRPFRRAGVFGGAIAMWLTLVLAAMPPFIMLENAHPAAAFYEASSAAITLGSSLLSSTQMSTAMVFYRSMVAWLGGLLTLMLAIYVLGRYGVGGTPNRDLRFVLHGASRGNPRLGATFVEVAIPYVTVTVLCILTLSLFQVPPARAVLAGLNTLSTNGFLGWSTNASIFNNRGAELALMVFMVIGATSIIWQRTLLSQKLFQTHQQRESLQFVLFTLAALLAGLALSLIVFPVQNRYWEHLINRGFDIVSTLTTTGLVHSPGIGIQVPLLFLLGLALIGGTSYSTAGGLKFFRLLTMVRHSRNEVLRLLHPNQLLPGSVDTDEKVSATTKATWSAFFSSIVFILLGMAVFAGLGHEFVSSLALSIGAFTSVGYLVSDNLFFLDGSGVPYLSLIWVGVIGIAGRVELLVILAALSRKHW